MFKYKPFLKHWQSIDGYSDNSSYSPIYWDDGKLGQKYGLYDTLADAKTACNEMGKVYRSLDWWKIDEMNYTWEILRVEKGTRVHGINIDWEEPLEEWPVIPS